jgi:hypothetical protein
MHPKCAHANAKYVFRVTKDVIWNMPYAFVWQTNYAACPPVF